MTPDDQHVAELVRLMRELPLEEMEEVQGLLDSIRELRFALFVFALPPVDVVEYSVLDILRAPRSNRVLLAQYAKDLEEAAKLPYDEAEEAYRAALARGPLALVRKITRS